MSKPPSIPRFEPDLATQLFVWLTENLDLPFTMHPDPSYEVRVNGYALKTRLQLMNRDKKNLARFCLILGALCGVGIGWSLPW